MCVNFTTSTHRTTHQIVAVTTGEAVGARDMSASRAPTAPPAVAVATTTAATAVAAAANLMCHCGGVDICCHRSSTKYNKILDKKSEKRKKKHT